jgi:hypothetical protein
VWESANAQNIGSRQLVDTFAVGLQSTNPDLSSPQHLHKLSTLRAMCSLGSLGSLMCILTIFNEIFDLRNICQWLPVTGVNYHLSHICYFAYLSANTRGIILQL